MNKFDKNRTSQKHYDLFEKKFSELSILLNNWKKDITNTDEKQFKKIQQMLLRYAAIIGVCTGFFWTCSEMISWYYDKLQISSMAEKYASVADEMYEKERLPRVALNFIQEAIDLAPDNFEYHFKRSFFAAANQINQLISLNRPLTKEELITAHNVLAEAKLLHRLRPNGDEAYVLEAEIYIALKQYNEAKKAIDKAIDINPANTLTQELLAVYLLTQNSPLEAQKVITNVIEQTPNDKHALLLLGVILKSSEQYTQAIQTFNKVITLDPNFDTAYYYLGLCHLVKAPTKSQQYFEKALKINPVNKECYYQLALLHKKEQNLDLSLRCLKQVLKLDKNHLEAIITSGKLLAALEKYPQALQAYNQALSLDFNNQEVLMLISKIPSGK